MNGLGAALQEREAAATTDHGTGAEVGQSHVMAVNSRLPCQCLAELLARTTSLASEHPSTSSLPAGSTAPSTVMIIGLGSSSIASASAR